MNKTTFFDQSEYDVRCEWGLEGLEALAPTSDVVIIVDVLSFSTAIDAATARGARVYPYRWKDDSAKEHARSLGAELADPTRTKGKWSLSPVSLMTLPENTKLVLPSPNGSTLSLSVHGVPTFAACFRNAKAVANAAQKLGRRLSVIAAGERWQSGTMRPALEDWLGAGAVIRHLSGSMSPEAQAAKQAFEAAQGGLNDAISHCSSGKELVERGFQCDIDCAVDVDRSNNVPILVDGFYVSHGN